MQRKLNPAHLKTIPLDEKKKDGLKTVIQFIPDPYKDYWNTCLQDGGGDGDGTDVLTPQVDNSSQLLRDRINNIQNLLNTESQTVNSVLPTSVFFDWLEFFLFFWNRVYYFKAKFYTE